LNPQFSAQDYLFDDICTALAWLRKDKPSPKRLPELERHLILSQNNFPNLPFAPKILFLTNLLTEAGILDTNTTPIPEATRSLLSLGRYAAIRKLFETWIKSSLQNELKQLDQLECLGQWENDPTLPRLFLMEQLKGLEPNSWYAIDQFIEYIHSSFPDFQRPDGSYDVWLIRRRSDGMFLQGFENWYAVEGELLRYLIIGPFLWFGVVELSYSAENPDQYFFRLTPQAADLIQHPAISSPEISEPLEKKLQILSSGIITIPRLFHPSIRYQIARFCDWKSYQNNSYLYRVTPASLRQARQKNLKPQQLIGLLQKYTQTFPPFMSQAIRRWAGHSTEIQVQRLSILRVRSPEILKKVQKSHASKYIQQILNPTTAIIAAGKEERLTELLLSLGFLADIEPSPHLMDEFSKNQER